MCILDCGRKPGYLRRAHTPVPDGSPHRPVDLNSGPSCYQATMIPTTPMHRPFMLCCHSRQKGPQWGGRCRVTDKTPVRNQGLNQLDLLPACCDFFPSTFGSGKRSLLLFACIRPVTPSWNHWSQLPRVAQLESPLFPLGNLNAHVGTDNKTWRGMTGEHDLHDLNPGSGLLLDFCPNYNVSITYTLFINEERGEQEIHGLGEHSWPSPWWAGGGAWGERGLDCCHRDLVVNDLPIIKDVLCYYTVWHSSTTQGMGNLKAVVKRWGFFFLLFSRGCSLSRLEELQLLCCLDTHVWSCAILQNFVLKKCTVIKMKSPSNNDELIRFFWTWTRKVLMSFRV